MTLFSVAQQKCCWLFVGVGGQQGPPNTVTTKTPAHIPRASETTEEKRDSLLNYNLFKKEHCPKNTLSSKELLSLTVAGHICSGEKLLYTLLLVLFKTAKGRRVSPGCHH